MATRPKAAKDGPPRWTFAAGAIVAIGGLGWGIVSYFIPKPEPPRPPVAAPPPNVTVSGNGSVGVGVISGGQISIGAPASQPAATTSAPARGIAP